MHTKRSLEAIAAISAAGILVSGEATYVQFSRSTLSSTFGTLWGIPLGLLDLVAFGLVFIVAVTALWRRTTKVLLP